MKRTILEAKDMRTQFISLLTKRTEDTEKLCYDGKPFYTEETLAILKVETKMKGRNRDALLEAFSDFLKRLEDIDFDHKVSD